MPNYVTCNLKFKNHESCLKFKELLIGTREGSNKEGADICFNKLIPIPSELDNSTAGAIEYSKAKLYNLHIDTERDNIAEMLEEILIPYYKKVYNSSSNKEDFIREILYLVLKDKDIKELLIKLKETTTAEMEQYIKEHSESYYLYTKYGYGNWYNARVSLWVLSGMQ